jgi:Uma2 family endonuclease
MTVTHEERLLTWDDYLALPGETRNTDLIDGKVVVNAPSAQHERILGKLAYASRRWLDEVGDLGEWTTQQPVPVNERRGYQPDASWFPAGQCGEPDAVAVFTGLPAIVVEVLSPSTRSTDLLRKRGDYERLGVREFWVLDPVDASALVMRFDGDRFVDVPLAAGDELTSPLLPGFTVTVGSLFVR